MPAPFFTTCTSTPAPLWLIVPPKPTGATFVPAMVSTVGMFPPVASVFCTMPVAGKTPPSDSDPMVLLKPANSSFAPLATIT